ncbi:MAG: sugar ABC transporter permease [Candidatus Omnitrophica bacterium]|nr:sugar ABC transporter permease [Candidatus Omnitrophota bacterium]
MNKKPFLQELNRQKMSYIFIAAPFILFLIFVLGPAIASFILSFTKYNVIQPAEFVGMANYKAIILQDARFWKAIKNTLVYVIGVVPFGICIALILAVAIDQRIKAKNFFKGVLFLPTVTSIVASSVMWRWLFAGEKYGFINYFIVIKLGLKPVDWLLSPTWTLPSIIIMSIWAGLGYNVILFLAGLQTIPHAMYEAAEVDGAGYWHKFFRITIPLLKPTIVFVSIMSVIVSFQVFEQVYLMTGGGGGQLGGVLDSALTAVPYLFDKGFNKFQMGYASSMAYILFFIIFTLTFINIKFVKSKVEY